MNNNTSNIDNLQTNDVINALAAISSNQAAQKSATVDIHEFASMMGCSVSSIRNKLKTREVPTPMKRKTSNQTLKWKRSAINRFLGVDDTPSQISPDQIPMIIEIVKLLTQKS